MSVVYKTVEEAEKAFQHKQKFVKDANGDERPVDLCFDCGEAVEVHAEGGAGYVSPESLEVPVQTGTGVITVAQQKTVCKKCYDAALERTKSAPTA